MKKIILPIFAITILASFFASQSPDGLDKVSLLLGFSEKGIERHSLMTNYAIPFISNAPLSTALAGIIGVCFILIMAWFIVKGLKLSAKKSQ